MVEGVRFVLTDRDVFDATRLGAELAAALIKLYPGKIDMTVDKTLTGSLDFAKDPMAQLKTEPLEKFKVMREKYLLYR